MKPLDKSPVYGFLSNPSMVDYPGRLAAVFFVSGCNFRCRFCQNAELIRKQDYHLSWQELGNCCRGFANDWVDAAVITGGEPTLNADLPELIKFFRQYGWQVKLDTNGSRPDFLEECLPEVDYVAMDVKTAFREYPRLTSFCDTVSIAGSVEMLTNSGKEHEFRTTVIESMHTSEVAAQMGMEMEGAKRHVLQPFIPQKGLPDPSFETLSRTSPDYMERVAASLRGYVSEVLIRGD